MRTRDRILLHHALFHPLSRTGHLDLCMDHHFERHGVDRVVRGYCVRLPGHAPSMYVGRSESRCPLGSPS